MTPTRQLAPSDVTSSSTRGCKYNYQCNSLPPSHHLKRPNRQFKVFPAQISRKDPHSADELINLFHQIKPEHLLQEQRGYVTYFLYSTALGFFREYCEGNKCTCMNLQKNYTLKKTNKQTSKRTVRWKKSKKLISVWKK